jgi:hypothetical protein
MTIVGRRGENNTVIMADLRIKVKVVSLCLTYFKLETNCRNITGDGALCHTYHGALCPTVAKSYTL